MNKYEAITRLNMAIRREHEALTVLHSLAIQAGNHPMINLYSQILDGIQDTMQTFDVVTAAEWTDAVNRGSILE